MKILNSIDAFLWNRFLIFLLVGYGLWMTFQLRGMQFRYLFYSLKLAFTRKDNDAEGDISQFQALMTAMAATIGIASIAGVATAIVAGGFGAIFWMWVIALIGMATKYAEALLAIYFREKDHRGEMCGGPMYYIEKGLGWKWLGLAFALFGALSSFAGGNLTQSNSMAHALHELCGFPSLFSGILFALSTAIVLIGGIKGIGKVCAYLVPLMAGLYLTGGLIILIIKAPCIPEGISLILKQAFTIKSTVGGMAGVGVMTAMHFGIARGVSSNEAGLGSGPIAAAAAKTDTPGRQALISMSSVFLSTFIVCTVTALVIAVTHVIGMKDHFGNTLNGVALVMEGFRQIIPKGDWIVAISVLLFGYSTIIGWAYYGEKCMEYLLGERWIFSYRFLFCIVTFFGAILSLDVVWPLVDIMNGLMALPNLIGLFGLSTLVISESKKFFNHLELEKVS